MDQKFLDEGSWSFEPREVLQLKEKVKNKGILIKNLDGIQINSGIKTGYNEAFIIDEKTKINLIAKNSKNSDIIKPLLQGKDIKKWNIIYKNLYLIFTRRGINIEEFPAIKEFLYKYKDKLTPRNNNEKVGRKPGQYEWYEIQDNIAFYKEFQKEKIIWSEMVSKPSFTIDFNDHYYLLNSSYILTSTNEDIDLIYLTSLFNSNLLYWYFKQISYSLGSTGIRYINQYMQQLPIYIANKNEQESLVILAKNTINSNKKLQYEIKSFHKYLISDFNISKINKKLTEYYFLSFDELYIEVKKQYKQISRREKDMLEKEYNSSLAIIFPLHKKIIDNEQKIDKLVYELYDLTEEEIKIIEKQ